MRLIDADKLCEDLLERWSIADTRKEELIRLIMTDIVTPIVVSQPSVEPEHEQAIKDCRNCKYGNYNDHWDTHFCYNPDNCVDWNLWEVKDIEPEIIKCKDCKYNTSSHKCINPDSFFLIPKDEDFCSYAKRREE